MYKIGLTGGIASGKSTVLAWLKMHGVKTVDTDIIAREVVRPGSKTLTLLVETLGNVILNKDGTMNREVVSTLVFNDKKALQTLNTIMHGAIKEEMYKQAKALQAYETEAIVFDVPLLIETKWHEEMDEVWLVYVTPEQQLERLCLRNGMSREEALSRIKNQMTVDEKLPFADVVIDNSGNEFALVTQLETLWKEKKVLFIGE